MMSLYERDEMLRLMHAEQAVQEEMSHHRGSYTHLVEVGGVVALSHHPVGRVLRHFSVGD